jgi:transmembrane sensor
VALGDTARRAAPAMLTRGTLGRVASRGDVSVARDVDVDRYLAWTRGELVFDRTPMRQAAAMLSRWYGLDVEVADSSLAKVPLLASFKEQAVADVMRSIATVIGARVERHGRQVIFR